MSSETGQNLLLSYIRRLQEDLYSNEDNDYQFTIPSEHEETWLKIEKTIEHYDQIMSANRNEAMKTLEIALDNGQRYTYEEHLQAVETIKNLIFQAQAKEQELDELKEKAIEIAFSEDERHIHIKGKGIYTLQDCKPKMGETVKIKNPMITIKESEEE